MAAPAVYAAGLIEFPPRPGTLTNVSRGATPSDRMPPVQIDLHIHLPENKAARDYEAIIQDIAKYIYGREVDRG